MSSDKEETTMFLLLDNGRIHTLGIKTSFGKIESPTDLQFEPSDCVVIPTAGIRQRRSSSPNPPRSSTRTLGEGSKLVYLKQSQVLLYKCTSTGVLALMLDENGVVESSFELLSLENDGFSGPYSHFIEAGTVYRETGAFFRLVCTGKLTMTGQPALVAVEFNKDNVFARVLRCSESQQLIGSLEGVVAFSSPVLDHDDQETFAGERTFLAAIAGNGTFFCLGDDELDMAPLSPQTDCPELQIVLSQPAVEPTFALTIFERLTNVSEDVEIHFEGLGMPMEELKSRLSRDNNSSLTVHACTMLLSLPRSDSSSVIAAIRVCIGGEVDDGTASSFFVGGRRVEMKKGMKWYNVPLTDEEIAVNLRTKFVCVRFPSTQEIVALEVYADEASNYKIPSAYFFKKPGGASEEHPTLASIDSQAQCCQSPLALAVQASANILDLCELRPMVSSHAKATLWRIVEETAVHPNLQMRQKLQVLLECVDSDADRRNRETDARVLRTCYRALEQCNQLALSAKECGDASEAQRMWTSVRMLLENCLTKTALRVATDRPINYLQNYGDLEPSKSIASEAVKVVLAGIANSSGFDDMIASAVEIELIESAMTIISNSSKEGSVAISETPPSFAELLTSPSHVVVEKCCQAMSVFFKDRRDLFDALMGARLVAYQW